MTPHFNVNAASAEGKPAPEHRDLQDFAGAGSDGDISAMKKFLKKFGREHIDAPLGGDGNYNALMWTSKKGTIASIDFLGENGANINAVDRNSETPLLIAAWMGRKGAVLSLLFQGAGFTAVDHDGLTAAQRALKHGHPEVAQVIEQFARGENLDALKGLKDELLAEELRAAAVATEARIDRRTVPEFRDFDAFMSFAAGGDIPAMQKFLKQFGRQYIDGSREGEGGYNALMWVSKKGNVESIRFLDENGANVNYTDRNGETPLLVAAWMGHKDAVRSLLLRGANYKATDSEGLTPAGRALKYNHPEVAEVIEKFILDEIDFALEKLRTGHKRPIRVETAQFRPKRKATPPSAQTH